MMKYLKNEIIETSKNIAERVNNARINEEDIKNVEFIEYIDNVKI